LRGLRRMALSSVSVSRPQIAGCLLFCLLCTSCDLTGGLQNAWVMLVGGKAVVVTPVASPSPLLKQEYRSEAARISKANTELLSEVFEVVFIRTPGDRTEFGNWVDTLNQGASLEGVYNGFTHSSSYRKLELANPGASAEALRVFGQELSTLELDLPVATVFDNSSAKPLAMPVMPTEVTSENENVGTTVVEFRPQPPSSPSPSPKKIQAAQAEQYSQQFVTASIYTLKRVLGDEALKVIADKKLYKEKLAQWYSKWVVHMASLKVDYGLDLRNRPDEAFHYKWALTASPDRLTWEVLNRVHRALNEANTQK